MSYRGLDIVEMVSKHWNFQSIEILEQLHEISPRLIFKIKADDNLYILKGIPDEKPESTIVGNIMAHQYLGNEKGIAPYIFPTKSGGFYIWEGGFWFFLMEYIEGEPMENTCEAEYMLGQLVRQLHSYKDYTYPTGLTEDKRRFYDWFANKEFKPQFDVILDTIPDFFEYDKCFIHTDLGPHNVRITNEGKTVFIDLDDAGIGCRYLDAGSALILRFVEHDNNMNLWYRFDFAKAFLQGYYGEEAISRSEYDLLWHGATYMFISYMQCYGPEAVDSLWKILQFGLNQKEKLWEMIIGE